MPFKCIFTSCCSACFELENDFPYYVEAPYSVSLNDELIFVEKRENVFSLMGLIADTEYVVSTSFGDSLRFTTKPQSACLNAADFGAAGDGEADDTSALQMAIDACPKYGKIRINAGNYRVRPLTLKSFITLELEQGARLVASEKVSDYPVWPAIAGVYANGEPVISAAWEGRPHSSHQSVLSAQHAEEIYVVGGCVDGNAQNSEWWIDPKKRKVGRPRMLFLNDCENVSLHGVTVRNSPSWNLHPYRSRNIGFYDIQVAAPADSPNTDGCDPESCDGVEIIGARFSVGDDAIAIKSGKAEGNDIKFPKSRCHVIRNCLMEYAHGAVVLGSEMSGGIAELTVCQCLFNNTDRGLRIKTRRGRGKFGIIDGVRFENILMNGVKVPFVINMFYFCDTDGKTEYVWSKKPLPVDDRTPYLGNFVFKNIKCFECSAAAGYFYGLPEQPIASVAVENAEISFSGAPASFVPAMMTGCEACAGSGFLFKNVKKVELKNVFIKNLLGERLTLDENVELVED